MKKILGLTAVLAVCIASLAFGCPNEKSASAASVSGKCAGTAACPEGSAKCAKMSATAASAGGSCTMGTKASAAKGGACCESDMEHTTFSIAGLSSAKIAKKVNAALAGVQGVSCVHCDKATGTATVCWKKASMNDAVSAKLESMGLKAAVVTADARGAGECPYAKGAASGKACPHDAKAGSKDKDKI